jgi:gas vesicle protein
MQTRSGYRSSPFSLPLMVVAVAAGAVAGLIFAPANGAATRARVRSLASTAGSRLRRYAESMYDRMPQPHWGDPVHRPAHAELSTAPLTATVGEITSATQSTQQGATS